MKLPSWSHNGCAPYFFITSHTAEYPIRARSDQDGVRAAGAACSLIKYTGIKEVGRHYTIKDLLSDVQAMLGCQCGIGRLCYSFGLRYWDILKVQERYQLGLGDGD
eukprot:1155104-Pelagomonas_calceolata.AAC.4